MSSVRMSDKLRERIIRKGEAIFSASLVRLNGNLATDFHDRAATEYIESEIKQFISDIPTKWCSDINRVTYQIIYMVELRPTAWSWSEESLAKRLIIPKIYGLYSEGFGDSKTLNIPIDFNFSEGLESELTKWRKAIRDTNSEQKLFLDELKRIVKRCNTLKQFLDTWPQGENIVPPEILAKLNEKPVREKKEPLLTEEASVALSTTLLKRTLMS